MPIFMQSEELHMLTQTHTSSSLPWIRPSEQAECSAVIAALMSVIGARRLSILCSTANYEFALLKSKFLFFRVFQARTSLRRSTVSAPQLYPEDAVRDNDDAPRSVFQGDTDGPLLPSHWGSSATPARKCARVWIQVCVRVRSESRGTGRVYVKVVGGDLRQLSSALCDNAQPLSIRKLQQATVHPEHAECQLRAG